MRGELVLESGRSLALVRLTQQLTYAWMLEGVPTRRWNDRIIEEAVREAEQRFNKSHVIRPDPAGTRARTNATTFARKRHEEISLTIVAMVAEKSMGKHAAREVAAEGLFDITRETALVGFAGMGEERLEMIAHDREEDGLLG